MKYAATTLLLLFASVAFAQSSWAPRSVDVSWGASAPRLSFSAKDLADARVRTELSSGLRKRFVVTTEAFVEGSNEKIARRQFACAVTSDLWDEGYVVRIGTLTEQLKTLDEVLDRCLGVQGLIVGESKNWAARRGREVYFAVRAEFNPISPKQCSELIKSSSGDDTAAPITISLVRRRICKAERIVEFRSPVFRVPR